MVNKNEAPEGCIAVIDEIFTCEGCCFHNGNCTQHGCLDCDRKDGETVIFIKKAV